MPLTWVQQCVHVLTLHVIPGELEILFTQMKICLLFLRSSEDTTVSCGSDDPAAWFNFETILGEAPDVIVSGHESDGSGCSASSRIEEQQQQPDSVPTWCCSKVQSPLEPALPDEDMPEFSEEDLRMCLDVACQGLGLELGQPAGTSEGSLVCSNDAAHSMDACLNLGPPVSAPLLRASSTTSSVSTPPLPCQAGGIVKGQVCSSPGLCLQQPIKLVCAAASKGANRKRGRPRRYDTTLPLLPGTASYPSLCCVLVITS